MFLPFKCKGGILGVPYAKYETVVTLNSDERMSVYPFRVDQNIVK